MRPPQADVFESKDPYAIEEMHPALVNTAESMTRPSEVAILRLVASLLAQDDRVLTAPTLSEPRSGDFALSPGCKPRGTVP